MEKSLQNRENDEEWAQFGRTQLAKAYGEPLPKRLELRHIEVHAGRSTQATLLGRNCDTYESLYRSPALAEARAKRPSQLVVADTWRLHHAGALDRA
jgi:hypothetical protein